MKLDELARNAATALMDAADMIGLKDEPLENGYTVRQAFICGNFPEVLRLAQFLVEVEHRGTEVLTASAAMRLGACPTCGFPNGSIVQHECKNAPAIAG